MTMTSSRPPPASLVLLPLEIQHCILSYLPIPSLLTYASTSRHSFTLATGALTSLHLAVFSKRVHGVLAYLNCAETDVGSLSYDFLQAPAQTWLNLPIRLPEQDNPGRPRSRRSRSSTTVTPNVSPQVYRERQIHHQNAHLSRILSASVMRNLSTLSLHSYALLSPSLASALSSLSHLRHLTLNFSHPAIHDPCLPAFYWASAPPIEKEGCTAWNLLAGIGDANARSLRLNGLRSLHVRRAAITSRQLREWVLRNAELRELCLAMVTGVDAEFVEGLAKMFLADADQERRAVLTRLEIENCPQLELKERENFAWVEVLLECGLKEVDFRRCRAVDMDVLREVFEERRWGELGLVVPALAGAADEDELETRSLDHETTVGDSNGKGKGPAIEIDPNFD
ncbi:uncharacterized protein HMPREF1541_02658 [Cyphellophora europaea CBS 101466]|uniref:F-box domain-containing protein n=1 Tax=Cyphellophora europaea (strain CBS 101466) TaxID=1220924 RepID=W2S6E9_CYPE1|nr:uncharacterized protein HMPREF1541_02658 [Cyphellophora europaea CBS 101466]ETN43499.1 hypothetical protein HMPREF1541_02658 [Cyphellophora europaea CBS 101466]